MVVDSSFPGLGLTNANFLFHGLYNCTEIRGFENMAGARSFKQAFVSCSVLETIYATGFDATGVTGALVFSSCSRLVGSTGFAPAQTTGAAALKLGDGGVLTGPSADARPWVWGTVYDDGTLEASVSDALDEGRTVVASRRAQSRTTGWRAACRGATRRARSTGWCSRRTWRSWST